MKKTGIELIVYERQRQIEVEGWTPEHDAYHSCGELARAAATYALPENYRKMTECIDRSENGGRDAIWEQPELWPFDNEYWKPTPDNRIKELVKAGALIAAEIDRLQAQSSNSD